MSLSGKTIVITRDLKQAKSFVDMLKNFGANVLLFPTIKITGPDDPDLVRANLLDISAFEWVVFTSTNAVRYFFKFKNKEKRDIQKIKIACVGKKTAEALEIFNFTPTLIPEISTNYDLLETLLRQDVRGKRVLLPVSNIAGKDLQVGLEAHGALVERIEVYNNIPFRNSQMEVIYQKVDDNLIDCITFFSPSAINTFADLMGEEGINLINTRKIPIAVIGPTTALAARELNLKPTIQPPQSDEQSFVEEIKRYFGVME
jgi:uroporphyrinogen-III synthase